MKKLHVFLFALIALLAFSSCSDDDNDGNNAIVGKWQMTGISATINCTDTEIKERIASNYEDITVPNCQYEFFDKGKFKFTEQATENNKGDNEEGDYTLNSRMITFITDGKTNDKETELAEYSVDKNILTLIWDMTEECRLKYENNKEYEGTKITKVVVTHTYIKK